MDANSLYCTENVSRFRDSMCKSTWMVANSTCTTNDNDGNREVEFQQERATRPGPTEVAQVGGGRTKVACSPTK